MKVVQCVALGISVLALIANIVWLVVSRNMLALSNVFLTLLVSVILLISLSRQWMVGVYSNVFSQAFFSEHIDRWVVAAVGVLGGVTLIVAILERSFATFGLATLMGVLFVTMYGVYRRSSDR